MRGSLTVLVGGCQPRNAAVLWWESRSLVTVAGLSWAWLLVLSGAQPQFDWARRWAVRGWLGRVRPSSESRQIPGPLQLGTPGRSPGQRFKFQIQYCFYCLAIFSDLLILILIEIFKNFKTYSTTHQSNEFGQTSSKSTSSSWSQSQFYDRQRWIWTFHSAQYEFRQSLNFCEPVSHFPVCAWCWAARPVPVHSGQGETPSPDTALWDNTRTHGSARIYWSPSLHSLHIHARQYRFLIKEAIKNKVI